MFNDNKDFYPTPSSLAIRMINKVNWSGVKYILEPSAGKGDLIDQLRESKSRYSRQDIHAIEKDPRLRNMLIGSGEKVVGDDFLTYNGFIQFDAIVMNPPFSNGENHLLKAIELIYSGQIVCLLNAETIRTPSTVKRKDLVDRLNNLNAEIEYIDNAFLDAERKTAVEIALVYINIERKVEDDLLKGASDTVNEFESEKIDGQIKDVALNNDIKSIVKDFNFRVQIGLETLRNFYQNHKYIGSYISLKTNSEQYDRDATGLTVLLKEKTNDFLEKIRHDFWNRTLSLPAFEKRLTVEKRQVFRENLKNHSDLEFTENNIRSFLENLVNSYEDTLLDAIETLFDSMTMKYSWDKNIHNKNVHYYNGWKTNDSFKINKKVILPNIGIDPYWSYSYKIRYESIERLNDIDKVMNYFDGSSDYSKISDVAEKTDDIFSLLESEYFKIRFYKKGTTHLTFKSEDIRRRFNIEVGKRKGWLPMDYGHTPFKQLSHKNQEIVKAFEDKPKDYDNRLNQIGIAKKNLVMLKNIA